MAASDIVIRYRSEFDASGANEAVKANDEVTGSVKRFGAATEDVGKHVVDVEISKRRLIHTTESLGRGLAVTAASGLSTSSAFQGAAVGVGAFTHILGGFGSLLGPTVLIVGALTQGILEYTERQEQAKEKTEAAKVSLEFYTTVVKTLEDSLVRTDAALVKVLETAKLRKQELEQAEKTEATEKRLAPLIEKETEAKEALKEKTRELGDAEQRLTLARLQASERFKGDSAAIEQAIAGQKARVEDLRIAEGLLRQQKDFAVQAVKDEESFERETEPKKVERRKRLIELEKMAADARIKAGLARLEFDDKERLADLAKEDRGVALMTQARSLMSAETSDQASEFAKRRALVDAYYDRVFILLLQASQNGAKNEAELLRLHKQRADAMLKIDQDEAKARSAIETHVANSIASIAGNLANVLDESQDESFNLTKALRYGEAIINTAAGMNQALADYGPTPAGYAAMAAAFVTGMANVATIAGASRSGGGSVSAPSGGTFGGTNNLGTSAPMTALAPGNLGGVSPSLGTVGPGVGTVNVYLENLIYQGLDPDSIPAAQMRRFVERLMQIFGSEVFGRANRVA